MKQKTRKNSPKLDKKTVKKVRCVIALTNEVQEMAIQLILDDRYDDCLTALVETLVRQVNNFCRCKACTTCDDCKAGN
jgi:hypothetical protein